VGKAKILQIVAFAFVFAGCVQEDAVHERQLCIELTSFSAPEIPVCTSQEKCLEQFDESFSPQSDALNPFVQNNLHEFKNRVSLSWLYFNKALDATKKINTACSSGSGLEGLDKLANELNFNLQKSFEQIEAAHELAFAIVLLEKADLEQQGVDLVREEEIFNDFVALNESANSINLQSSSGKDFAAQYFFYADKFSKLSYSFGFDETTMKETSVLDAVDFFDEKLLPFVVKDKFLLPLVSPAYQKVFGFFKGSFEVSRSLESLASMPSFELFNSINWFSGTITSSTKKFVDLINSDNFHRRALESKNLVLESDLQALFGAIEQKILLIDDSTYSSLDEGFLQELALLTEFSSGISSNEFSIKGLSTLKTESTSELSRLKSEFNDLKSRQAVSGIGFGEKTNSLKEILAGSRKLGESIDFFLNEAVLGLKTACDERVPVIKEKIEESSSGFSDAAAVLAASIKFKANEFAKANEIPVALKLCKEIVEDFSAFQNAVQNNSELIEIGEGHTNACLAGLEDFFNASLQGFSDLEEVFERLEKTKSLMKPNEVLSACNSLKEKTLSSFNSLEEAKEISLSRAKTQKIISQAKTITKTVFPESIINRFLDQQKFFDGQNLSLNAAPLLHDLRESSARLLAQAQEALKKSVQEFLEKSLKTEVFSESGVHANKYSYSKIKISVENPAGFFDFPVSLLVKDFSFSDAKEVFRTPNVQAYSFSEGNLAIDLNFVPVGSSVLSLEAGKVYAKTVEKTKVVFVSQAEAFIERVIEISSDSFLKELFVSTTLSQNAESSSIKGFFKSKNPPLEKTANEATFRLFDVSPKDALSVFFSVKNPVTLEIKKADTRAVDDNSAEYFFTVQASNNLELELENIKLFLPVSLEEKSFLPAKAYTADGEKIMVEEVLENKLLVSIKSILPGQKKEFFVELKVKNFSSFWQKQIELLGQKISVLKNAPDAAIRQKASLLEERLLALKQSIDFANSASNSEAGKELLQLSVDVQKLLEESNLFEKTQSHIFALKEEIRKQLLQIEQNAAFLKSIGFDKDSESILSKTKKARLDLESLDSTSLQGPEKLFSIKSFLNEIGSTDAGEALKVQAKKLAEEGLSFLSAEKDFGMVLEGKGKVLSAEESVLFYLSQNDFVGAKNFVDALKGAVDGIKNSVSEQAKKVLEKHKQEFEGIEDIVEETRLQARMLKSLEKEFLEKLANRFFPTSSERIDKLLLKLDSLPELDEKIKEIESLESAGSLVEAAKKAQALSKEFSKPIDEAKKISAEFSGDLARVKEDAFNAYYIAELKAKSKSNAEIENLLLEAKQKLDQGDFVQAILLSEQAESMVDKAEFIQFNIPVAVYPIILLAVVGMFFRYRQKKKPEPQKVKVERVRME